ncbi:MAG: DNA-binding protein [Pseudomonadales bacterium RIFCSPLOWO2_12_60_38]|jgi:excisionase family DNA binding protein|uniref:Helix-turn-helix domain-containing protein n=1 Tax=Pseudomonas syringae pv. avii TaxID=663959 RepID=A0A3M5V524_PSESX|nr:MULTISPECIES: helix-turn-helix domain-containing protein [Pseudomonas]AFJ57883.1 DNA binding domain protein, excisionase family [Pseudomonas fluorescens A506]ETK39412.1 DNA-binding protein [Pseudomonas fluorescens FH5]MBU0801799.1 helix-turn-helix domain-containing protein [Alphaproteobacteria bacterium]MDN5399983.1 helix-turn-helix domain-containing protein [Pseudomonas sp.]MDN5420532.1 helix-turn-helix domain-containing protein [Pseudomonadales bacterium]OHC31719.1 MAG: DNA-binding prote
MTINNLPKTILPLEKEVEAAVQGQRELASLLSTKFETQRIDIFDKEDKPHRLVLPTSALRLLVDILGELALGNAVKVVPVHAELTSQEAADLLNVSRPHLVKMLEEGAIPFTKTGRHRRVRFSDLMAFKQRRDEQSQEAMEALVQQAQELGMGYDG